MGEFACRRISIFYSSNSLDNNITMMENSQCNAKSPMKRNVVMFLLKTNNECHLTQSTLKDVTNSTSEQCQQVMGRMKRKFSDIISKDSAIHHNTKRVILEEFEDIEINLLKDYAVNKCRKSIIKRSLDTL